MTKNYTVLYLYSEPLFDAIDSYFIKYCQLLNINFEIVVLADDGTELAKIQKVRVLRNDRRQGLCGYRYILKLLLWP